MGRNFPPPWTYKRGLLLKPERQTEAKEQRPEVVHYEGGCAGLSLAHLHLVPDTIPVCILFLQIAFDLDQVFSLSFFPPCPVK